MFDQLPKKSLGQNFFVNEQLGDKIVDIVGKNFPKLVLEVGPGLGFFTSRFITRKIPIICVEKDQDIAKQLPLYNKDLNIIQSDFLDVDFSKLHLPEEETVCFGSLPYNSSKKIISKCIESVGIFKAFYFIVQKEVAEKYVERARENSILSMTTKLFVDTEIVLDISPGSFNPKPKVYSSFIKMTPNKNRDLFDDPSKFNEKFIKFIKEAFAHPRRQLQNNLKIKVPSNYALKRPAELSFDDYVKIFSSAY